MQNFPLTTPQKRIWYAEIEHKGSSVNNIAFRVTLPTDSIADLESAWNAVVCSGDAFRLHLKDEPAPGSDFPVSQYVAEFRAETIPTMRFDSQAEADCWLWEQSLKPFDLFEAPLYRVWIVETAPGKHSLHILIHHLITDGFSVSLLQSRLLAALKGEALPESVYQDYLPFESAYAQTDDYLRDKAYWLEQASRFPEPIQLGSGAGEGGALYLAYTLRPEVQRLSLEHEKTHGLSVYKQFVTVLETVISRFARVENFALGMANHNRSTSELKNLFGMFVSTLPLMLNSQPNLSFSERGAQISKQINRSVKDHSRYPFGAMVADARKEFGLDLASALRFNLVGHHDRPTPLSFICPGTAPGGMTIHVNLNGTSRSGELAVGFSADGTLFSKDEIDRFFGCIETVLEAALKAPDKPMGELPLLRDEELKEILSFNGEWVPYPYSNVQEQFSSVVESHRDKPAVIAGGQSITFAELDAWSDQIAAALSGQENRFVGICTRRDCSTIAALFGVFKAGAAYVPMDPTYPRERLQYMAEDAGIATVLCHREFQEVIPEGLAVLKLDGIPRSGPTPTLPEVDPEARAYAIYTSGTTGKPKGVPIRHHQVNHLCQALPKRFSITEQSICLLFASLNFDASVADIFPPLLNGATLVVANQEERTDGSKLLRLLQEERVTTAVIPPALLAILPSTELPHLSDLVVAGEATDPSVIERWSVGRRMINAYGPTETTVATTAGVLGDSGARDIGPPLDNLHCYVLDPSGHPLPVGVAGELYAAGPSISEGYLGRPELNAERFLPNPFARPELKNPIMYKTGDLVRWFPSGHIEYIGRVDFQVKIRGHRIECGEVANAVSELPGVTSCIVIPLPSGATHRLVAYLISEKTWEQHELRAELAKKLPDYMVPSAFVVMKEFPMTPNGKVDRRALPVPEETKHDFQAPETEMQKTVCSVWESILPVSPVGITDDFFDLGGDSLSSMKVVAELEKLGYVLEVSTLRDNPTVAELCLQLKSADGPSAKSGLQRVESSAPFAMPVNSLMMTRQEETAVAGGAEAGDILVRWFFSGTLQPTQMERALDRLVEMHDIFRLSFDGETLTSVPAPSHKTEKVDSLDQVLDQWQAEPQESPRCRFRFFQTGPGEYALILRATHELIDAWSSSLIETRLFQLLQGEELAQPFQYRDFAAWHSSLLQSGQLEQSETYWKGLLSSATPVFSSGLSPDKSVNPYTTVTAALPMAVDLREALESLCKSHRATLFEGAYAVYNMLLARRGHGKGAVSGYVSAMRGDSDLQQIAGSFTNRLYMAVDTTAESTFGQALQHVQERLAQNTKHNLFPAWQVCDPEGRGYPDLFFHLVPRAGGEQKPLPSGLEVRKPGPGSPQYWPLGLAVQFIDSAEQPLLLVLGRAGFTSAPAIGSLLRDYLALITELTTPTREETPDVVTAGA